mmetsp:Transcript_27144/g.108699  ORF Transcript_27144/g.108699 Transcript_27144/m.108699 type:complete len:310 (+) Transcript_27144:359-1288(+)
MGPLPATCRPRRGRSSRRRLRFYCDSRAHVLPKPPARGALLVLGHDDEGDAVPEAAAGDAGARAGVEAAPAAERGDAFADRGAGPRRAGLREILQRLERPRGGVRCRADRGDDEPLRREAALEPRRLASDDVVRHEDEREHRGRARDLRRGPAVRVPRAPLASRLAHHLGVFDGRLEDAPEQRTRHRRRDDEGPHAAQDLGVEHASERRARIAAVERGVRGLVRRHHRGPVHGGPCGGTGLPWWSSADLRPRARRALPTIDAAQRARTHPRAAVSRHARRRARRRDATSSRPPRVPSARGTARRAGAAP